MPGYNRSQAAEDTRRSIVSDDNPQPSAWAREYTPCCFSASRVKLGPGLPSYLRVIPDQVTRRAASRAHHCPLRRHLPGNPGVTPRAQTPATTLAPAMGRAIGSPHGWGDGPMTAVL